MFIYCYNALLHMEIIFSSVSYIVGRSKFFSKKRNTWSLTRPKLFARSHDDSGKDSFLTKRKTVFFSKTRGLTPSRSRDVCVCISKKIANVYNCTLWNIFSANYRQLTKLTFVLQSLSTGVIYKFNESVKNTRILYIFIKDIRW